MMIITRRQLLRKVTVAGIVGGACLMLRTSKAWALEVVYKLNDLASKKQNPALSALKYVDDAATSKDRVAEKTGVKANEQTCSNCSFYKDPGTIEGTKDGAGKCMIFGGQVVYAKGWCNSWSKAS